MQMGLIPLSRWSSSQSAFVGFAKFILFCKLLGHWYFAIWLLEVNLNAEGSLGLQFGIGSKNSMEWNREGNEKFQSLFGSVRKHNSIPL